MKANKEIRKTMLTLFEIKNQVEELEEKKKKINIQLQEMFMASKDDEFETKITEKQKLVAKLIVSSKQTYYEDLFEEKLDKKTFNSIVDKDITVNKAELREVFENNPEIKSKLKKALTIKKLVNKEKLEDAYSKGSIPLEIIKECCSIKTSNMIRLSLKNAE